MSALLEDAFARCPLVPVLVVPDTTDGASLGRALAGAGLTTAEVTLRSPAALDVLAACVQTAGERLVVGAGTVVDVEQVDRVAEAGGRFVVSPALDLDVVARARELGLAVLPGVATPGDVQRARRAGLDLLKLFPASVVGGPGMAAALAGPYPGVRLVPTGGVDASTAPDYLARPNVVAVGGSWFVPAARLGALDGSGSAAEAAARADVHRLVGEALAGLA